MFFSCVLVRFNYLYDYVVLSYLFLCVNTGSKSYLSKPEEKLNHFPEETSLNHFTILSYESKFRLYCKEKNTTSKQIFSLLASTVHILYEYETWSLNMGEHELQVLKSKAEEKYLILRRHQCVMEDNT